MNKLFVSLLVAAFLFVSLWSNPTAVAVRNQSPPVTPTRTPQFSAEIERLELDRNEIVHPCRLAGNEPAPPNAKCPDDKGSIAVKTLVKNPRKRPLIYAYTVSGGFIVGTGESVVWNLKDARPGTYTIIAGISEGRGFNPKTQTATITVTICACPECYCPTLSVTGVEEITAGETAEFTANVSGGTSAEITYNWTVSQGEIVEGQGTPTIRVETTDEMTGTVEATVEIGGEGLCPDCTRTASATAKFIQ